MIALYVLAAMEAIGLVMMFRRWDWRGFPPRWFHRIAPHWWFLNANSPTPEDGGSPEYLVNRPEWIRWLGWHFIRNPLANFAKYVIGLESFKRGRNVDHLVAVAWPLPRAGLWGRGAPTVHRTDVGETGLYIHFVTALPFVSWSRGRTKLYIGWRRSGAFGLKVNVG